jgi:3-oxoacyl-[acyl-carrier protein] reductase
MISVKGKWALVTGASRGVGRRIARALAEKGCNLVVHSRTVAGTESLAKELNQLGVEAISVGAELSSWPEVEAMISRCREITGDHLDILYNNAGLQTPYGQKFSHTPSDYELSFRVNAIAPAKLCDAFLPGMLGRNWGRIVNTTSGIRDQPEMMPYSCSKAALDRYVRDMIPTLAGTNVLMNLMDPGWLRTDMGGPSAPNDPDTVLPGALVPVLLEEDGGSGGWFNAQDYRG